MGRVICTTPDGATGGDRLLREALADVDEPTFTNVFAVGLDEVQELGTLSRHARRPSGSTGSPPGSTASACTT